MKRSLFLTTGVVMSSLAPMGTAQAAPAGRLSGAYGTTQTVASSTSGSVGAAYYVDVRLRPGCATGICATTLSYVEYGSLTPVHVTLRPSGTAYVGTGSHVSACLNDRGTSTLVQKAYNTTESYTLNVSRVVGGTARSFTGTRELKQVLTAAARKAGCPFLGTRTFTLKGTHA